MSALKRRAITVPAVVVAAALLLALLPLWLPVAAAIDLARGRLRLPTVRLLAFAVCWSWLEITGVGVAAALWLTGQGRNRRAHYALQHWWTARLMAALRVTTGISIEATEASCLSPGPVIMLCRHASLADSLLSAWVITSGARMNPRYVLKRELLFDPCLDIVGNRLPNHFLDRSATDSTVELDALERLATGLLDDQVAVIFPEGTRSSPKKRARALAKIEARDPERAGRLGELQHLLPPRPAGSQAMLRGCPQADVVVAWHVGFDGLDTFGGILRHLGRRPRPVQFHVRRVARSDVPDGDHFIRWLDDAWLQSDRAVHTLLQPEGPP